MAKTSPHTTPVRTRAQPHLPQQKARQHAPRVHWRPARRARAPRPAPRGPTAGTPPGRPRRAGGAHLALRRAAPLRAGALCHLSGWRQGRASCRPLGCRPRRRRAHAGRRCKVSAGTVRNLWQPLRAAQALGASAARENMYLSPVKTVAVVARARRTPQSPPVRDTSTAISAKFQTDFRLDNDVRPGIFRYIKLLETKVPQNLYWTSFCTKDILCLQNI